MPLRPVIDAGARETAVNAWRAIFATGSAKSSSNPTLLGPADRTSALDHPIPSTSPQQIPIVNMAMPSQPQTQPGAERECRVIADEDLERSIASANDEEADGYFGLMGDGLGEDDVYGDDDHEELDPHTSQAGERRPLPPWLKDGFNAKVNESARSHRGPDGLPPLYRDHQTFWFPCPSTFFLLRNSVSPQDLYNPRFFLWDPAALCPDGIPCPTCHVMLKPHGHIPRPRRCIDVSGSFWMIGYRYRCSNCIHSRSSKHTVTFRSWDPRILAVLPQSLSCEFPA